MGKGEEGRYPAWQALMGAQQAGPHPHSERGTEADEDLSVGLPPPHHYHQNYNYCVLIVQIWVSKGLKCYFKE